MTRPSATQTIEQGPIRPPSEAKSLFIRVTRNCPWNKCLFCPVYKRRKFSRRSVEEVKADIDLAAEMIGTIKELSVQLGSAGRVDDRVVSVIFGSAAYPDAMRNVAAWLYYGEGSVFLQDANNMLLPAEELTEIVTYLHRTIPGVSRVTSYARSKSVCRKTQEELTMIRQAGLDRLHIGLETAHDPLLKFMKKGVTGAEQVEAGQKAVAAGFQLSEYVMPGLGGVEMSEGHARDTALALNAINPHFIRLRTLRVPKRVELYNELEAGRFTLLSDDQCAAEIRLFISLLDGITSRVVSDHIMNLIETVGGQLPDDKPAMLAQLDAYFDLDDEERLLYRIGRRAGFFREPADLSSPTARTKAESIYNQIQAARPGEMEAVIREMADGYI